MTNPCELTVIPLILELAGQTFAKPLPAAKTLLKKTEGSYLPSALNIMFSAGLADVVVYLVAGLVVGLALVTRLRRTGGFLAPPLGLTSVK